MATNIKDKKRNGTINQWLALNNTAIIYKWVAIASSILLMLMLFIILYLANQSPVVVTLDGKNKIYHISERKVINIDEDDVKRFILKFINIFERWEKFDPEMIIKNVAPFTTDGLKIRLLKKLKTIQEKDFKDKTTSQDIANLHITVTKENVIASYDKVLRVNEIPLVVPCKLSFELIKDTQSRWNMLGLYINGITEYKGIK